MRLPEPIQPRMPSDDERGRAAAHRNRDKMDLAFGVVGLLAVWWLWDALSGRFGTVGALLISAGAVAVAGAVLRSFFVRVRAYWRRRRAGERIAGDA